MFSGTSLVSEQGKVQLYSCTFAIMFFALYFDLTEYFINEDENFGLEILDVTVFSRNLREQ